jgi:hypothetical protein
MPAVNRRGRTLLLLALALALGCGGGEGDDGCERRAYRVVFGPGTGTCADLDLDELSAIVGEVEGGCQVSGSADADRSDCAIAIHYEAAIDADGRGEGQAEVERSCHPIGASCEHSFAITLEPIVADP